MKGIVVVPAKPVKRKRDRTQPANIHAPEDVRHECARCETLQAERDRLREALTSARTMLVAFGGDPRGSANGDEIQAAILDLIDAALEKEAGR